MLQRLKPRSADMRTIKPLSDAAERQANAMGEQAPGPEHFLLAALDLPDGLARQAFVRAGADLAGLAAAIAAQHGAALATVGVDATLLGDTAPVPPAAGLYRAKGSMEDVMRTLAELPRAAGEPLTGAHVVQVIAAGTQGSAARALRAMPVDAAALVEAARVEIAGLSQRAA
jgi:ATP-dependent Clp protease ATP-binding subunit ClpA